MPLLALSVLTLGGLGIGIAVFVRRRSLDVVVAAGHWRSHLLTAGYVTSVFVASASMMKVGFLLTAAILSAFWLAALSGAPALSAWNVIRAIVLALVITASVHAVFVHLLRVPLP
jgi:hypothetical protein